MNDSIQLVSFLEDLASDSEKRRQFLLDPDTALEPYSLTENEVATMRALVDDAYGHSERGLRNLAKMLRGLGSIGED